MEKIYIISLQHYSGKTFVSIGIINALMEKGYRIGYVKPIGSVPQIVDGNVYDASALMIKRVFNLKEDNDVISPFVITYESLQYLLKGEQKQHFKNKIFNSFNSFKDKDYLIVAGAGNLFTAAAVGLSSIELAREIRAKILLVEDFSVDFSVDNIIGLHNILGDDLLGCIINKIPSTLENYVNNEIINFLEKQDIKVFGCFTKDKTLETLTIRDIVNILNGKVLCCEDKLDEFVENYSIGAMDVENALKYFRIMPNKAVITGAHRADIQLAALETSTNVLVLTGGTGINDIVLSKAISCGVPVISVEEDTFSVITKIEFEFGKNRIKENKKIEEIKKMFKEKFDLEKFVKSI